ncbi:MAG: Xaa-Pro peptidase family protein [Nitrospiraceae bacterium]|nr:Xaa-Pro peptidase family protein [Nitrospiraceae bacterium]
MSRVAALTGSLESRGIDGFLISDLNNVRYLTGFTGSSGFLVITAGSRTFFTDSRYEEQAGGEVKGWRILIEREDRAKVISDFVRASGIRTLGFEATASYAFYRSLLRKGFRLKAITNAVEELRKIKDQTEVRSIQKAIQRAEKAFTAVKPRIRAGESEKRISALLEENLKKAGCRTLPFDIIVASGPNSSMPHAKPTDRRLSPGDLVVIDWGGEAEGYFSDMTRTLLINGRSLSRKKEIYEIVLRANRTAINTAAGGAHARAVDKAARDVITEAGYGGHFGHGTGHGVGIEVHELPRVSRLGRERIKAGMVFTIEPGIYLPGTGGVRIEDMVVARKDSCSVLTTLPKELEII